MSIFDKFWGITCFFLFFPMVDKIKASSLRKTKGTESRRSSSKAYYFQKEGKKQRVCLIKFIITLGIKEWTVRYWFSYGGNEENHINMSTFSLVSTESKRNSIRNYLSVLLA